MASKILCLLVDGGHRYGAPVDRNWKRRSKCVRCGHVKVEEIR